MKTTSPFFQKSLLVVAIFLVTTFVTFGASSNNGGLLRSTPYQTISATADAQLNTMTNGSGATILNGVIAKIRAKAEEKAGTPINNMLFNAYIDERLSLLDKLDNEVRVELGPDYAFLFQYIYPRVYNLKKPTNQSSSLMERIGIRMGITSPVNCTSFTYSPFGSCQSTNTQARTVAASTPAGCTGGIAPVLSQACTNAVVTPPVTTTPPKTCTGNVPTGAGVKRSGYTDEGMIGVLPNSSWRYANQNYSSCVWSCDIGYFRNGDVGCTKKTPGTGITVRVLDDNTKQPISGVNVDLYGSLSVAGGTSFGNYTTSAAGNTPEFFWSESYYGYRMILILNKSGYILKSGSACEVSANTPKNCWLPYQYAGTDNVITVYMSDGTSPQVFEFKVRDASGVTDITDPIKIARLTSIKNSALSILVDTSPATLQKISNVALDYQVSIQDLATAMGYYVADMENLFKNAGVNFGQAPAPTPAPAPAPTPAPTPAPAPAPLSITQGTFLGGGCPNASGPNDNTRFYCGPTRPLGNDWTDVGDGCYHLCMKR